MSNNEKRVLSLDGGGIKMIFQLTILAALERELKQPLFRYFDHIIGTSSGAILASAIATGINLNELLEALPRYSKDIFNNKYLLLNLFRGKHALSGLKYVLQTLFQDTSIASAKTKLYIPLINDKYQIVLLSSEENDIALKKVLLGATLAPIYFDFNFTIGDKKFLDAGLAVNNPSFLLLNRLRQSGCDLSTTRLFSLGSGKYPAQKNKLDYSGIIDIVKLMDTFYFSQVELADNLTNTVLLPENYLRINPELEKISMDDTSKRYLHYLQVQAEIYWQKYRQYILDLILSHPKNAVERTKVITPKRSTEENLHA